MHVTYSEWIAAKRADAIARGATTLRHLPGSDYEHFRWAGTHADGVNQGFTLPHNVHRAPGEIINPITGEFVTGCLSVAKLSKELRITSHRLSEIMERLNFVDRVLAWKDIPMVLAPHLSKPLYFHTTAATKKAVEDNLVIPVKLRQGGSIGEMLLVTPEGQRRVAAEVSGKVIPQKRLEARRVVITDLYAKGHSQAEIVKLTKLPKQTVSRHLAAIKPATQTDCPILSTFP